MKNKKGFTLVELLAVIVILALIMGVAIVGIVNVISSSKTTVMYENAQSLIEGLRKQFAIKNVDPEGNSYGFDATLFESGGAESPLGGTFQFRTSEAANVVTPGLWKISTTVSGCTATTKSYVSISGGVYTICLFAGAGEKYLFGTQTQVAQKTASIIQTAPTS